MSVKMVWITPEAERIMAYCARVSSNWQDNPDHASLLRYCIRHHHWSVFEMASMCMEITTSRAISAQIIRHRSFCFQEFSQRYAPVQAVEQVQPRRQDHANRQSSHDDLSEADVEWFTTTQMELAANAQAAYQEALERGIAKESARFLLPMAATTRLYMAGTIRSWIHYLQIRTGPETQSEHRAVAEAVKHIFCNELPIVAESIGWR